MKKQNQKGITLIALIITIIVMLILVGVTINVALNGGLFQKAEYASEQMQIEAEKEELLSAVMGAIGNDGKIKFGEIQLPAGWNKLAEGNYKSPKDNMYKVYDYGKIEYIGKYTGGGSEPVAFEWSSVNLDNVDTSAEYKGYIAPLNMTVIVSFTEDGRVLMHESGYVTEIDAKNPANIDDATGNLSFSVEINGTDTNIVVTMNDNDPNIYANIEGLEALGPIPYVKQGKTIYSNEEVLKMLGESNSTGTYNGTWTKIGEEDGKMKLVSTSNVTSYTIGYEDPKAIKAIPAVDESAATETEKHKRSIWSYRNAIYGEETLNTAVKEATGITSARSIKIEDIYNIIGEENIDKNESEDYLKEYKYNYENHKGQTFVNDAGDIVVIDSEGDEAIVTDSYYYSKLTEDQKTKLGTLASGDYWIISPCVDCDDSGAYFMVHYMSNGDITIKYLVTSYVAGQNSSEEKSVRAVVLVPGL